MASGSCDAPQFAEAKSQAVKLYFSCTELKSDPFWRYEPYYSLFRHAPFAVLYEWDESNAADQGTGWTKTGRTEAASHTDPKVFTCNFVTTYFLSCLCIASHLAKFKG